MHALRLLKAAHDEELWLRRQKRNASRPSLETINEMPEQLFQERFRLNKKTFSELCCSLRNETNIRGTKEIPLEVKVLCALSFFATGSYQRIVGVTQHLPQRTTSRCIRQVVEALNSPRIVKKWIVFPQTHQERTRIRQEFQRKFQLPGVIGCIDCTHISIVKPHIDEQNYFNRKGYHSLNVQMICDDNLKIINVNAKYGGATHDSFIWSSSEVEPYMRGLHENGELTWLLGDSGYPQRAWLMTPILNAEPGSRAEVYTTRHLQARNCIERCFGVLKARWRCLLKHRTLHYHPRVASEVTIACCVLHNIALDAKLPPPNNMAEQQEDGDEPSVGVGPISSNQDELMSGRIMLNNLVNRLV
ncbi:putative nuclease HARBI1 [Colias croceus]|uniref:putative nuclease HARBI1 n=1 Tax=Colias crocea TaxID=72248 RepID=UPI001E27A82B|nr:putative nuclease HARBI1 [Colias croceus]XP_045491611.1 putative nuclease HARBI1 [Colias croceus]XP_045491612.1 putative nuclease HARBI1 [Colias croceus]XP_045491613.1 putative nuclease HARBI1 [Colias croceus]XP_045492406.1 putative nuclease HARBI1 [Colias croceus]XP_045492412.1 putative nuclease HARBI1 [Colias croceus]XP_045492417.1 putative nuclease HARBI1 [Colias croceus]XP_045492423.1 putative nuclease HARBI1 [Colias croceus]XP_045493498.1 putative nuclease HARBI1 [Colias croceus]XP